MGKVLSLPFLVSVLLLAGGSLRAQGIFKRYPLRSGMIFYDINVTGTSKGFTTHTSGIARLVFDHWGARELKEEDSTEVQTGDFNETRDIRSMTKMDHGTIYTVDFDDRTIYKTRDRDLDLAIARGEDLSDESVQLLKEMKAVKIGTDEVAGFPCDVWRAKDQKICLYKGIPLKITVEGPGFYSERKAVQVVLNRPVPDDQFKLPDFPMVVDDEYTNNAAAETRIEDYIASIQDLQSKMKSLGINPDEENATLTPEQEKAVINTLGARYLAKQKRLLPKLLVALKGARECVAKADDGKAAEECIAPVNRIDEELGDKTEQFDYAHFREKKAQILDALKREISYLEVTNDCVRKYDKTTDVILCTEGNLGGTEQEAAPAQP